MMNITISLFFLLGLACVAVAGEEEQPQVRQSQVRQPQVRQPQVQWPQVQHPQVQQPQVLQPQVQQSQSLPIPYKVFFPRNLQPGWNVAITGEVPRNADNFTLDFICDSKNEVAFHLKPHFKRKRVVRNHRLNSTWGVEEKSYNPLRLSKPFQLRVTMENKGFKVDIDNNFFCYFEHRIPYHRITHLSIFNDIILKSVKIREVRGPEADKISGIDAGHNVLHETQDQLKTS